MPACEKSTRRSAGLTIAAAPGPTPVLWALRWGLAYGAVLLVPLLASVFSLFKGQGPETRSVESDIPWRRVTSSRQLRKTDGVATALRVTTQLRAEAIRLID